MIRQIQRNMKNDPAVVLVKDGYAVMLGDRAKDDMKKIARATGIEMRKNAHIALRRGRIKEQITGIKTLNSALRVINSAQRRDVITMHAGIATGYANAMNQFGLMTDDELTDVIEIINLAGVNAEHRVKTARHLL